MTKMLLAPLAGAAMLLAGPAAARIVEVTLTVENLAPTNSIAFAPLRFGFHAGTFDSFDEGATATAPIISVAEGGSGADWFPAFAAAEPQAVLGSVDGVLTPGQTRTSMTFRVDTSLNPYFTFASMVVPSNDFFIGNDDPMEYLLFDPAGNLILGEIGQLASEIWNAGSESFDPANAAFIVGGNNDARTAEGGVVEFNFAELAQFDGLTTAGGYVFTSGLTRDTPVYRISFTSSTVPEPATWAMLIAGFGLVGGAVRRRRSAGAAAFA